MTAAGQGVRSELWNEAFQLVKTRGLERRPAGFVSSSGMGSPHFVNGKRVVDSGERLSVVCRAICELIKYNEVDFNTVGGMTMGADSLAVGIAMVSGCGWFSIRKVLKDPHCEQWIEGTCLGASSRVLLVDDVIGSGGAMLAAMRRIQETGATVCAACPMVDRSEVSRLFFEQQHVAYLPLVTYRDLEIAPVS